MWKLTSTLAGVTAISVFTGINAVQAATLFQDTLTAQNPTISWTSKTTGTVNIYGTLAQPQNTAYTTAHGWLNQKDYIGLDTRSSTQGGNGLLKSIATVNVDAGSVIDFSVKPTDNNWSGFLDLKIDLASSGTTVGQNPPPSLDSGLVFLDRDRETFDHVGLWWNNQIYEASPAYQDGQYFDILNDKLVTVQPDRGVQNGHTLGSFIHLSPDSNPQNSPIQNYAVTEIDRKTLQAMADFIQAEAMDKGYTETTPLGAALLTPFEQKGYNNKYTGIGLIERAAEEANVRAGQGFIPDYTEYIKVNRLFAGTALDNIPWECLEVFPATVNCQRIANRNPISPFEFNMMSPEYLHYILENGPGSTQNWLQGWFESIDFILTDPLGRRLGYTEELGRLNEITYINENGKEAYAMYTTEGEIERFYIPERLDGRYVLEFYGNCGDNSLAIFGDNENGTAIAGCKQEEKIVTPVKQVPEPATGLGLFFLGLLGIFTRPRTRS